MRSSLFKMRARLTLSVLFGAAFAEAGARASPPPADSDGTHPWLRFVNAERGAFQLVRDRAPGDGERVAPALDCEHANHDVTLDPVTGSTVATLDLRVRANGSPLSVIGLSMDQGLRPGTVTAPGRSLVVAESEAVPLRNVLITLSPPLGPGETTVLHIPYAGTLSCGTRPDNGAVLCVKDRDFAYFARQSLIPYVFDPDDIDESTLDAMTRNIVLRVPPEIDVVSTGEKLDETVADGTKISTWTVDRPLSRSLGTYVFAGKLGMRTIPHRAVPTTFVFPNPELPVDDRLVSWSAGVLDFVEKSGGTPLPFSRSLTLVRLPQNVNDPGTATFGMTLLSESYTQAGNLLHEETWAHENSHLFWGIVVPESSSAESRMMSEGMATLSQIEYSWARHFSEVDRELYLARRFVPIGLDLRTQGQAIPPIAIRTGQAPPNRQQTAAYTLWAYYKTAATLDHLRATVGDEAFARGLHAYIQKCSYVGCRPDDLRKVLETVTGHSLSTFFERWVTATSRPRVTVGFDPAPMGATIHLSKDDDRPMTLELWLSLENGKRIKKHVDLPGRTMSIHLTTDSPVRSVLPNPRHDLLVDAQPALVGDINFDGETDGNDLLRCTPLVGTTYEATNAVGLWNTEARFDPRCDVNGDFRIDDNDVNELARSFGKVRTP